MAVGGTTTDDAVGVRQPPRPGPVVPRRISVLSGILAVGAAVGVSHLVAGLLAPASSPFLAVGNAFIDRTPSWLKNVAIDTFGTGDKTALLVGMALIMAAVGAAIGLLTRARLWWGLVAVVAVGLVGLAAVLSRPGTGATAVVAPLAAVAAGVTALAWLHRAAATAWPREVPRTPRGTPLEVSRRTFLASSATITAAAGLGGMAGQTLGTRVEVAASRDGVGTLAPVSPLPPLPAGAAFTDAGGLPFITANAGFYRIDTALRPPRVNAADWSLRIHGMVDRELTLTFDDLLARELIVRRLTLTCVSYEVGGDLVGTAEWTGVSLRELLNQAGVQDGADQLFSTSVDGFTASTPVDAVLEPDRGAMLAVNMNGEPLPVEHGFPVRMLVPGLYGYVSATKWITDIELTTYAARQAYWTPRGWSDRGPVKIASKVVSGRTTGAGALTVTGTAWATHTGIAQVEVRVDDGAWQPARLGAEVSTDTWRMWRADLRDVSPGEHTVTCRATDADGKLQTQEQARPDPDGATGWHTARISVT